MAHYNRPPAAEDLVGVIPGIASGAVTKHTFVTYKDGVVATATSGFADGIAMETVADGAPVPVKMYGVCLLMVNANSNNLVAGTSKIKPTTAGYGILAGTNKDDYSAVALGASTTDADCIMVILDRGTANI